MQFFSDKVQKKLNLALQKFNFSAERPFDEVTLNSIKDEFKRWDKVRNKAYIGKLQYMCEMRKVEKNKIKGL
jgi:hypothetical protein